MSISISINGIGNMNHRRKPMRLKCPLRQPRRHNMCLTLVLSCFALHTSAFHTLPSFHQNVLASSRVRSNRRGCTSRGLRVTFDPNQIQSEISDRSENIDTNPLPTTGKNTTGYPFPIRPNLHRTDLDTSSRSPTPPLLIERLFSLASKISRARRSVSVDPNSPSLPTIPSCHALIKLFQSEAEALRKPPKETITIQSLSSFSDNFSELQEAISRSSIQAIRAAADAGDYVTIGKIVNSVIEFSTAVSEQFFVDANENRKRPIPLIESRLFGEAIDGLSRTKAGSSKLRKMWSMFLSASRGSILLTPPGAFELNAMISALGKRDRIRAALDLYRDSGIECDAYTATTLLGILADSIPEPNLDSGTSSSTKRKSDPGRMNAASYSSSCWQWNETLTILDEFSAKHAANRDNNEIPFLNNYVYATALKVNEKTAAFYKNREEWHDGPKAAMEILERMRKDGISPDVVTCTSVMSTFNKGRQWKAAVALLSSMRKSSSSSSSSWSLPPPNAFTYAACISACARCNKSNMALALLEYLNSDENVEPNTWVYNAALAACAESKTFDTALSLLKKMEQDTKVGKDTAPNTVSYNSVIAALGGSTKTKNNKVRDSDESKVMKILMKMEEKQIPRDVVTYHNAIMACKSSPVSAVRILDFALGDDTFLLPTSDGKRTNKKHENMIAVTKSALSVCANEGATDHAVKIYSEMVDRNIRPDSSTYYLLMKTFGFAGDCDTVMNLLYALKGDSNSIRSLAERQKIDITAKNDISVEEQHYSAAVTSCLKCNKIQLALSALSVMKEDGMSPSVSSFEAIIHACCRMAKDSAVKESKLLQKRKKQRKKINPIPHHRLPSRSRAQAALTIMQSLKHPPARVLSDVAGACAAAGLWEETFDILRSLHEDCIEEQRNWNRNVLQSSKSSLVELTKLHRFLLAVCARTGNVSRALSVVDTIQEFVTASSSDSSTANTTSDAVKVPSLSSILLMEMDDSSVSATPLSSELVIATILSHSSSEHEIGMGSEDWKLLMIAASKARKWKICLGTLQFLQPYVERTHRRHSLLANDMRESNTTSAISSLEEEYSNLSRTLSYAIFCFESCRQYAWAMRAIDDWIEWSGRRPRKESVIAACRILSARGKAQQVINLVSKVLDVDEKESREKMEYERLLYIEAITALHKSGLYDSADELYVVGVGSNRLPWPIATNDDDDDDETNFRSGRENATTPLTLDLHNMTTAIAHSAVRTALQREIHILITGSWNRDAVVSTATWNRDVIIITGKGKNSPRRLRPVLRPEVQRMLTEEFYPPLGTTSVPGNMGALGVAKEDIKAWLDHQRRQKGKRMLVVADMLRSVAGGGRLRRSIMTIPGGEMTDGSNEVEG